MNLTFRQAVETGQIAPVLDLLAEDVVFSSPVVFRSYEGKDMVSMLLTAASKVFKDFSYVSEVTDGANTVLLFKAKVLDRDVEGVDIVTTDETGTITALKVMMRPLSAVNAMRDAMGQELGLIPAHQA